MTQDFVMGQLRMALMALVAFAGGKGWLTPTDSSLVIAFVTAIGPIFAPWIWSIVSNINTKRAPQNAVVIDPIITTANANKMTATVVTTAGPVTGKIVSVLLIAFALSDFLATGSAMAQTPTPKARPPLAITGNPIQDLKTDLNNSGIPTPAVTPGSTGCDFNLFAMLDPKNVVTQIQNCVSDVNKQFLPDVQAALDSATAFKDQPGIACLTPAVNIVKAAVGTAAVPAVEAQPANGTTPAVPAVAAVSAQLPGVILIFQKFREFVLAGGPAACKTWGTTTVTGATSGTL